SGNTYLVGLATPTYMPIMTNCGVESTREKMWLEYKRRAGTKNVKILEKALKLRAQAAQLLGYSSCSAYESEVRMAKSVDNIRKFYDELRPLVRKKAQQDYAEFTAAKRERTGDATAELMPWDFLYYQDQLLQSRYKVKSEEVREYFPMAAVVDG